MGRGENGSGGNGSSTLVGFLCFSEALTRTYGNHPILTYVNSLSCNDFVHSAPFHSRIGFSRTISLDEGALNGETTDRAETGTLCSMYKKHGSAFDILGPYLWGAIGVYTPREIFGSRNWSPTGPSSPEKCIPDPISRPEN